MIIDISNMIVIKIDESKSEFYEQSWSHGTKCEAKCHNVSVPNDFKIPAMPTYTKGKGDI